MAPITWGPRTCAPLPVVPTAAGGFEDLRKVKEKLALTLKNNGMGWGEGTGGGGAGSESDGGALLGPEGISQWSQPVRAWAQTARMRWLLPGGQPWFPSFCNY